MKYEYISFVPVESNGKTSIWNCINNKSQFVLGVIKWNSGWRQYCFFPTQDTVFSMGCLDDISDFIDTEMSKRKALN